MVAIVQGTAFEDELQGGDHGNLILGGDSADLLLGGLSNDTLNGGRGADRMQGGLGNDVYYVDEAGDVIVENADAGLDTVRSSISYTLGANLENLILEGTANLNGTGNAQNNALIGNAGANTLSGGAGNDVLNGLAGADTLIGGLGNDVYVVDNAGDVVIENADEGRDTVNALVDYTLGANVENLTLLGTANLNGSGNALANYLIGNAGANTLSGGAGNDVLNGMKGADTLIGGLGDDLYVVDDAGDVVSENVGEGRDTINALVDYTLSDNVENLTLIGTLNLSGTGNDLNNSLVGNVGANTLSGGAGNDVLNGLAGADTLIGGLGDDLYVVDNAADVVIESAGEGRDTINALVSYTLSDNVEVLTLLGSANLNGTGNALSNYLIGNAGVNTLSGGAGNDVLNGLAGADTLIGGVGDDTYVVDNAGDVVTENVGEGRDTVQALINYTLGANLENLTLLGADNLDGTGNALNNSLLGNAGDNVLNGGAGNDILSGAAGNDTLNGGLGLDKLYGGLGNDTYVVDNAGDLVVEKLDEGVDTVQVNFTYTLGANVENLTLLGVDALNGNGNELDNYLIGNAGANTLTGFAGNDTLDGGEGADILIGGAGDDIYGVDDLNDVVQEDVGGGNDTIYATVNYTLAANVENLILGVIPNGGAMALGVPSGLVGVGNDLNNAIVAGSGNDTLDGGLGADTLSGGAGNDVYIVDNAGDVVNEAANAGIDTVQSSISYTLGANVENLTLLGSSNLNGTGNALNNVIIGNAGVNTLDGGAGNDTLDGGAGADRLTGGLGDDVYVVDNAGDIVTESANQGADTVRASISYTLGANVENLTLLGSSNLNGTGNTVDNVLIGNAGANTLNGGSGNDTLDGGAGADTLIGGSGNDTYVVDNAGDVVTESASQGTDTVQSSLSYTLGANVENLTLLGSANLNGTGNTLNNVLTGNAGANTLSGGSGNDTLDGGLGADTLVGGSGNDTYVVDNAGDVVSETAGQGTDTVRASISYTLGANVENLTLLGVNALNATGNTASNVITGNAGNNTLDGGAGSDTLTGGAGQDILIGGAGADTYQLNAGDGVDVIRDSYTSTKEVDKAVFGATVDKNSIAFWLKDNTLQIAYGAGSDRVTVENQPTQGLERVQTSAGSFLTASDINALAQSMSSYAASQGIVITDVSDVKANAALMQLVNAAWH
ncbi:MAG: calcium-binding protein [Vampirovibrionales bacterium]|nr:calcium-binding protein [Vampirovibrionales bacterium]